MARGWESKSVESQMESAQQRSRAHTGRRLTPEQLEQLRQKESLTLSRIHVLNQLEKAENPRYRKILEKTLRELNTRLKKLGK